MTLIKESKRLNKKQKKTLISDEDTLDTIIAQPKLSNMWATKFINFGGSSISDSKIRTLQIISLSRPVLRFEGKRRLLSPMVVVFEDDMDGRMARSIQNQLNRQEDIDSNFSICLEFSNNIGNVVETWHYKGCSIEEVNYGTLDYSNSQPISITVLISVSSETLA